MNRRRLLKRWLAFNLVGFLGVGVQIFALMALRGPGGLHYLAATALAVEAAVLHNFVWHERWTWVDRIEGNRGGTLGRLARFNLTTGAVSIGSNLLLMTLLVSGLGLHYIAANLVTIVACSILNFLASDRLVFQPARPQPEEIFMHHKDKLKNLSDSRRFNSIFNWAFSIRQGEPTMKRHPILFATALLLLMGIPFLAAHPHFNKSLTVKLPGGADATVTYNTIPSNEIHATKAAVGAFVTPRQPRLKLSADVKVGDVTLAAGEYILGVVKNSESDWTMALYAGALARGATPDPAKLTKLDSMYSTGQGKAEHMLIDINPGSGKLQGKAVLILHFGSMFLAGAIS